MSELDNDKDSRDEFIKLTPVEVLREHLKEIEKDEKTWKRSIEYHEGGVIKSQQQLDVILAKKQELLRAIEELEPLIEITPPQKKRLLNFY